MLTLAAEHPHIYVDTVHISAEEAMRLVDLSKKYGYKKIVVSSSVSKIATIDQLKEMAKKGAFIEYTLGAYTAAQIIPLTHYYVETEYSSVDEGMSGEAEGGIKSAADAIREIGPEKCIMSTDFGRYALSTPVEGMRQFIACMLDLGFSPDEIQKMVKTNPEKLLGLK